MQVTLFILLICMTSEDVVVVTTEFLSDIYVQSNSICSVDLTISFVCNETIDVSCLFI